MQIWIKCVHFAASFIMKSLFMIIYKMNISKRKKMHKMIFNIFKMSSLLAVVTSYLLDRFNQRLLYIYLLSSFKFQQINFGTSFHNNSIASPIWNSNAVFWRGHFIVSQYCESHSFETYVKKIVRENKKKTPEENSVYIFIFNTEHGSSSCIKDAWIE